MRGSGAGHRVRAAKILDRVMIDLCWCASLPAAAAEPKRRWWRTAVSGATPLLAAPIPCRLEVVVVCPGASQAVEQRSNRLIAVRARPTAPLAPLPTTISDQTTARGVTHPDPESLPHGRRGLIILIYA